MNGFEDVNESIFGFEKKEKFNCSFLLEQLFICSLHRNEEQNYFASEIQKTCTFYETRFDNRDDKTQFFVKFEYLIFCIVTEVIASLSRTNVNDQKVFANFTLKFRLSNTYKKWNTIQRDFN